MSKYVVAVSGGVDSVVLLDMLAKKGDSELIVAHFDHGIRTDSKLDAEFVAKLAKLYKLPFETKREDLGASASEELARDRRYKFLRDVAKKHKATLVTAHHADDVVESITINLLRGTGWRGLTVLDSDVVRPITDMAKSEIINYAKKHKLRWREDSTNLSDDYLRNRIRKQTIVLDNDIKRQLLALWVTQKAIKKQIDNEAKKLVASGPDFSRYFFTHIDQTVAVELLRRVTNGLLTRPQLAKLLHAIKTSSPNKIFQAGNGLNVKFTSRNFRVELIK
jgi:tRNA(Ile)-lysidine synthetase-like protein